MKVDRPMIRMVTRKVYLRPTRSPRRPNTSAPNGRTRKPAAKASSAKMLRVVDVEGGEELRADDRGERAVEVEVVPFEDGAERRGEDDLLLLPRHRPHLFGRGCGGCHTHSVNSLVCPAFRLGAVPDGPRRQKPGADGFGGHLAFQSVPARFEFRPIFPQPLNGPLICDAARHGCFSSAVNSAPSMWILAEFELRRYCDRRSTFVYWL